jgi:hypothetical protein
MSDKKSEQKKAKEPDQKDLIISNRKPEVKKRRIPNTYINKEWLIHFKEIVEQLSKQDLTKEDHKQILENVKETGFDPLKNMNMKVIGDISFEELKDLTQLYITNYINNADCLLKIEIPEIIIPPFIKQMEKKEREYRDNLLKRPPIIFIDRKAENSLDYVKETIKKYKIYNEQFPARLELPINAQEFLKKIINKNTLYDKTVLSLLKNPQFHLLNIITTPSLKAEWIVNRNLLNIISSPGISPNIDVWTESTALNALEEYFLNYDNYAIIDLYTLIVFSCDLTTRGLANLLRSFWQLIIEKQNDGYDDDPSGLISATLHRTPRFARALAFDMNTSDFNYNLKSMLLLQNITDLIDDTDWWIFFIDAFIFELVAFPDFYEVTGWKAACRFVYNYEVLNKAICLILKRIAQNTRKADNVSMGIVEIHYREEIGMNFSNEFRAMMASNLADGPVSYDEASMFHELLLASEFDIYRPNRVDTILKQLIKDHNNLWGIIQDSLALFLRYSLSLNDSIASISHLTYREREKLLNLIEDLWPTAYYLDALFRCSNARLYPDNADISRKFLEDAVFYVDKIHSWDDDNIMILTFEDDLTSVSDLIWATKRCLERIISILQEGVTSEDEDKLIAKCNQAIGRIDAGEGSGS